MLRVATIGMLLALLAVAGPAGAGEAEGSLAIEGIPGPEDLVLDGDRLLVSSENRREPGSEGAIFAIDLALLEPEELPRIGEPQDLSFHPHGIDLVTGDDGVARLYVISHRREGEGAGPRHAVCVYEVLPHGLSFLERLEDPLLTSPNDLAALPDGGLYVTNDRANDQGYGEVILRQKRATVAYYDGAGTWSVAAGELGMPNGIAVDGDTVLVALTRENALLRFRRAADGSLGERERVARLVGPDNLTLVDGGVLVATHEKPGRFLAHSRNPAKTSPTRVYRVDLESGEAALWYTDEGGTISAGSTAVLAGDQLYLGQVFDPFVLRVAPQR